MRRGIANACLFARREWGKPHARVRRGIAKVCLLFKMDRRIIGKRKRRRSSNGYVRR